MLTVLDHLPEGFLTTSARDLHRLLPGPTLIHLPGRRQPALMVTVLQHGDEDSGWVGLQQVLRQRLAAGLPRELWIFVGNVQAAARGMRRLDAQPDYNRVWPGTTLHQDTPEAQAMAEVFARVRANGLFAAVDVHNNTGLNPHYGVVCSLDAATLHLARLFSRTMVWFRGLAGAQATAFARATPPVPAIAAECGLPGVAANADAAARLIDAALELAAFPAHAPPEQDIDLYHTLAIARVRPEVSLSFDGAPADLRFAPGLERLNFVELDAGTVIAHSQHPEPVRAFDEAGAEVTARFLRSADGALTLAQPAMPAMLTPSERAVRQDCLCYLMERLRPVPAAP